MAVKALFELIEHFLSKTINSWTTMIALLSLAISLGVAFIEYLNYSLNRLNLAVNIWSGQQNRIVFYNLSMVDAMITHWELFWVTRHLYVFKKIQPADIYQGDEDLHININGRSRHIHTIEAQYSNLWVEGPVDGKLFIKVFVAGKKKPVVKYLADGFVSKPKAK